MSGLVQGSLVIELPEVLAEKLRRLGIDAETYVLDLLVRALKLDPGEEVRVRVELARRFLDEGRSLVDRDPVQASEKLYRATEECVKVLAQYLNLREILESVMVVGGGVIGCEFAFILSSLGSQVTLVEALGRLLPLPSVDEDLSKVLQREMKKRRIKFMVNRTIEGVDEGGGRLRVMVGPSPSEEKSQGKEVKSVAVEVDRLLVCIGRTPVADDTGIERLGVKRNGRGWIIANERMETSEPHVYAVGDALGPEKIMLAHVASAEGFVAAVNAMGGNREMDYGAVPGAIFTMPEVADVGLTEAQAREQGFDVRSDTVLFRTLGKAQVIGEIAGQAKIVSDAGTGRILGVHMIGPHATDLIAEGTLAVQTGCTVKDLSETIHAHPTLSEVMGETAFRDVETPLYG